MRTAACNRGSIDAAMSIPAWLNVIPRYRTEGFWGIVWLYKLSGLIDGEAIIAHFENANVILFCWLQFPQIFNRSWRVSWSLAWRARSSAKKETISYYSIYFDLRVFIQYFNKILNKEIKKVGRERILGASLNGFRSGHLLCLERHYS
jgi:hypothetical protein